MSCLRTQHSVPWPGLEPRLLDPGTSAPPSGKLSLKLIAKLFPSSLSTVLHCHMQIIFQPAFSWMNFPLFWNHRSLGLAHFWLSVILTFMLMIHLMLLLHISWACWNPWSATACLQLYPPSWTHLGPSYNSQCWTHFKFYFSWWFLIISDHYSVCADLQFVKLSWERKRIGAQKLKAVDIEQFKQDIGLSPLLSDSLSDFHGLLCLYNSELSSILNKHSPLKSCMVTVQLAAPLFS